MHITQNRIILMVILGIIFLFAAGFAIVWYFTLATLTITTNSPSNKIMVRQKSGSNQQQIDVTQDGNHASMKLVAGTYIVTVQNATQTASQVVTLNPSDHKDLTLDLAPASSSGTATDEPVSSFGAGSISASKDTLRFIDRNSADRTLYNVDNSGRVTKLDSSLTYTSIAWANPDFGIGHGINKNNHYAFTKIEGVFVAPLKTPFEATALSSEGVAPNRTWYISDGHAVYRGNADGSFTEVYTSIETVKIMTVSNDAILLSQSSNKTREGDLIILHQNGDKYQLNGESYEAAWSPSGEKLVTSGDTSEVFDSKLNKVASLPNGNFISPTWLDDNTLVYGVSTKLIRYDLKTGASSTLYSFGDVTGQPSQIVPSVENDYLYLSLQKGGDRPNTAYRLDRIPLKGQVLVDVPVQKFALLIPNTIKGCELNFMNFANRFSIVMKNTAKANCTTTATQYFNDYGVSTTNLTFQQLP